MLNGAQQTDPSTYGLGLGLSSANVTVRGLAINGFNTQGILFTAGATGNTVAGCYVGTNAAGTASAANAFSGIEINGGATGNIVGGTTAAARNVILGNASQGIFIRGAGTNGNLVKGNFLGTNAAGTAALANGFSGIEIAESASANTVGGTAAGAGNIISGNSNQGVAIHTANGNTVAGNFIGTNAAGTAALGNGFGGIQIFSGATNNTVGGTAGGAGNVVAGNPGVGISVSDVGSTGNVIVGNFIGTNPAGTAAIPNAYAGVQFFGGASGNTVGTGNLISGNTSQGVLLSGAGTNGNGVRGNFIGLNAAGTAALANGYSGVEVGGGAQNNVVGGTTPAARNILSGNANQGVSLNGTGTTGNRISGNYIGANPAGTAAIANGFPGVEIFSNASANIIGGTAPGAGNVISGNAFRGATIAGANNNVFTGNLIGLNAAGTAALPNAGAGIQIFGGAQGNTSGATSGGRNFIAGNNDAGLTISGNPTSGNVVVGNSIGVTPSGTLVANVNEGISLFADGSGGSQNNTIGGTAVGADNLISGNGSAGVAIYNAGATGNRISGNSIAGNGGLGIDLWNDGVTANDLGDGDSGPNNLQNFPVLTSAVLGTATTIAGSLNSTATTTFRIEFFANATGSDKSRDFIGSTNVTTDASGNAPISTTLAAIAPVAHVITATATDPSGNTSEFSAPRALGNADSDGDGLADAYELAHWPALGTTTGGADSDGDGMRNAQEYRAGTDPRDPASVGADETLSLANVAGHTYRIDFTDALSLPTPWRILADQIPGTGAAALSQRYYRAVVEP